MINHIFIIHRKQDTDRDISKLLQLNCNHIEIIEPIERKEDTTQLICMWSKKQQHKQGVISLYETNIYLLNRIHDQKLDKVLILEDDAELIDNLDIVLDDSCMLQYLNIRMWKKRNCSTLANYYPSHERTKELLDQLIIYRSVKKNKHRAWDLELDYMKNKYTLDFSYYNCFNHPKNKSLLGNDNYNLPNNNI